MYVPLSTPPRLIGVRPPEVTLGVTLEVPQGEVPEEPLGAVPEAEPGSALEVAF